MDVMDVMERVSCKSQADETVYGRRRQAISLCPPPPEVLYTLLCKVVLSVICYLKTREKIVRSVLLQLQRYQGYPQDSSHPAPPRARTYVCTLLYTYNTQHNFSNTP